MKIIATTILCVFYLFSYSQRFDSPISTDEMQKDLKVWKEVRLAANSGLYKYRTESEIDSIYQWAGQQVFKCQSYRDFYKVISQLNDFEGSLHNSLYLPPKIHKELREETTGYFPFPIKIIEGLPVINYANNDIPLGSIITSINELPMDKTIPSLHKYYTTDGFNLTGKKIGICSDFALFYRYEYGLKDKFEIQYRYQGKNYKKVVSSIGNQEYNQRFVHRHSKVVDAPSFWGFNELTSGEGAYQFTIENNIGNLTINSFLIGWHGKDPKHLKYKSFLDSIFTLLDERKIQNLIVDVRHNGGGSDPNDLVTYEYLADRPFQENISAWISFNKIPHWKYVKEVPFYARPLEKYLSNKGLKDVFPNQKENRYYQSENDADKTMREPKENAFKGNVYLLVGPRVASAGSLFAAMLAGNKNCTVIGEETQGGYFGHNGHSPIRYQLPNSKIKCMFSIVNLEQDVLPRNGQLQKRGVMPDIVIEQSYDDFMNNYDRVLNDTLSLIKEKRTSE